MLYETCAYRSYKVGVDKVPSGKRVRYDAFIVPAEFDVRDPISPDVFMTSDTNLTKFEFVELSPVF